jgi:hydroxypyruvate isomerase
MENLRQSFAWWSFAQNTIDPENFIRNAAQIGYSAVEMIAPEYFSLTRDCGLTIVSITGHNSIEDGLNKRENHDRIEQEILANLELAQKWNIPNLICFSGSRSHVDDEVAIENTAKGFKRVAKAAEAAGVTLLLELLNSKIDHPNYNCDNTPWGVKVIDLVNSPNVKLLYDIYHMQIMEGDIIRTIQKYHQYFAHYHTAGNPGRHDMDETQELYYPPIYKAIHATGYTGYIGHEFIPKNDALQALKVTFNVCAQNQL